MIRLKSMKWFHAFSYGPNNEIDFSKHQLLQLLGKNGHGKSSIALILEEVLYNKNSKGIKKANIINRNSKAKQYTIELEFEKDSDTYTILTVRGATQSVKLTKNGEDISAHTSTGTYKLIEEIIGFDHKTFTQIVYQSNAFSLEFLTATDTNRKKFLIDLLNLTRYSKAGEYFKELAKDVSKELEIANVKLGTVTTWLRKHEGEDLTLKEPIVVPEVDTESINKLEVINSQIANIESTNKRIAQNNKYKEIRNSIKFDLIPDPKVDLVALNVACNEAFTKLQKVKSVISGATKLVKVCPSCGQTVDNSHKEKMVLEAKEMLPAVQKEYDASALELSNAQAKIKEYNYNVNSRLEWERYHSLIDNSVSSELLDIDELERTKSQLTSTIWQNSLEIKKATSANSEISANNARVEVIRSQILSMEEDKQTYAKLVNSISSRLSNLQILTKTFSPTGLVAYKIEVLVKDLEDLTNKYLQDMSDGRFQLGFKISSSDKLDVVITDNGVDIDIFALSNGELARVNVSTLLAIRKLMQSLSNSRINLLILDETVESLDTDGKERLIEVLLKEEHLNTVLVSHGFTHPLLEKLSIIKENNISRIE